VHHNLLSDKALDMVAGRFRILSEPVRLRILQRLQEGEASVGTLVEDLTLNQANVSKHLQLLHQAGVVNRRREGLQVFYRIADQSIFQLCNLVCGSLSDQLESELGAIQREPDTE
jgi:DNA-binding transcriptional ArsR family regulator